MSWKSLSLCLAALVMSGLLLSPALADQPEPVIGQPAPQFSLQDQNGNTVSLSDFAGKIVVLEWFNEECPIVQRHYRDGQMNALANKYAEKGVVWLAINSTKNKTNEDNKKAAAAWNMNRPILNDSSGDVGHAYHATNTPGMYIIDRQQNLVYWGAIDDNPNGRNSTVKNYVAQALDELLAGQSVSEPKTKPYGCTVKYAK